MKYLRICILSVLVISTFLIITAGTKSASEKSTNSAIPVIKDIILPNNLLTGKKIFDNYCIACHGSSGKGDGPEAYQLEIKPTDFTSGLYKFKSTPYGTLPTEEDIVNTLKLGVRTTAMLPQLQLNDEQMHNVAEYILRFSPKNEKTGIPITIPASPERTNTLISLGKNLFKMYCASCHGNDAKGDGPLAKTMTDYKKSPIHPANLTFRPLKRGNSSEWLYKIVSNGIEGTPMPPFEQVFKPKEKWAVVYFLGSIKKNNFTTNRKGMGMMGGIILPPI